MILQKHSPALLHTLGLTKKFGGLTAVDGVEFKLPEGELRAVIGPNGAGKTTFVNLVVGLLRSDRGQIFFAGNDITSKPPHVRSRIGIGYTFQLTSVFPRLSVFENVRIPVQSRTLRMFEYFGSVSNDRVESKIESVLHQVGLEGCTAAQADSLAHGDQRKLELAIAIALEPRLLILDEPTQGMSERDVKETIGLIRMISRNKTILIIEHNMDVVLDLAERITVFDKGRIIAEGTSSEIEQDQNVIDSYLGAEWRGR